MRMIKDRIYTEAFISKSMTGTGWEVDTNGNPIVVIEASNENLDYDGERVLRTALMNSYEYFMENGVISYDHKHLQRDPDDPTWTAEKYIIGKPLDAWEGEDDNGRPVVKVKAVLSRSNEIAKQIITKLKDGLGTVKASVGGRRVTKANMMDTTTFQDVPTIISVDWDEVALTHKPVNQTLGATMLSYPPSDFVKSMTAGSSADPNNMGNSGNTLQVQSMEAEPIQTLLIKMRNKEISKSCDAITHLVKSGYSEKEAGIVLKMIIDKDYLGDVMKTNKNNVDDVTKDSADELKKALDNMGDGNGTDGLEEGATYVKQGNFLFKAMKKKGKMTYEKTGDDSPDYEGDDEEEDDDEDDEEMEKSIDDEFYDVTEDVRDLKKSVKNTNKQITALTGMVKSLVASGGKSEVLLKSMATVALDNDSMLKSISGAPQPRMTGSGNIAPIQRYSEDMVKSLSQVTIQDMSKSLTDANIDVTRRGEASILFRRGGIQAVAQAMPQLIPTILGKKE